MKAIYIDTVEFPLWGLNYLIYGDGSDLTSEEIEEVDNFTNEYPNCNFKPVYCNDNIDIYFSSHNCLGTLPCEVCELKIYELIETQNNKQINQ